MGKVALLIVCLLILAGTSVSAAEYVLTIPDQQYDLTHLYHYDFGRSFSANAKMYYRCTGWVLFDSFYGYDWFAIYAGELTDPNQIWPLRDRNFFANSWQGGEYEITHNQHPWTVCGSGYLAAYVEYGAAGYKMLQLTSAQLVVRDVVPEPSSLLALLAGMGGIAGSTLIRRRQNPGQS